MDKDIFWINNPYILFEKEELQNFVPDKKMTLIEKMNAVTRFCIFGLILGYILNFRDHIMYVLFTMIILTIISYKINIEHKLENKSEINSKDLFTPDQINHLSEKLADVLVEKNPNVLENFNKCTKENSENNSTENNSNNKCSDNLNENQENPNIIVKPVNLEDKAIIQIQEDTSTDCKKPTKDNPLMNRNLGDKDNLAACEYNEEIKENINEKFNYNLYQDMDDFFERSNSQRQFYTMPVTKVVNDQTEFAEWLYKAPKTCKENSLCLKYEDNRYNK